MLCINNSFSDGTPGVSVGNNPATSSDGTRGSVVLAGGQGQEA
jgi:hypothetical protein